VNEWDQRPPGERDARKPGDDAEAPKLPPVVVPFTALSPDALSGVVDNFVLREGTDYGERDVDHETKCMQVRRQLERGEADIVFDPESESVSIMLRKPGSVV
jgi:uncharacterized protein YheU (UPF0270 family)